MRMKRAAHLLNRVLSCLLCASMVGVLFPTAGLAEALSQASESEIQLVAASDAGEGDEALVGDGGVVTGSLAVSGDDSLQEGEQGDDADERSTKESVEAGDEDGASVKEESDARLDVPTSQTDEQDDATGQKREDARDAANADETSEQERNATLESTDGQEDDTVLRAMSAAAGQISGSVLDGVTVRIRPKGASYSLSVNTDGNAPGNSVVHMYNIGDSSRFYFKRSSDTSDSYYIGFFSEPSDTEYHKRNGKMARLDVDSNILDGYDKEGAAIHETDSQDEAHQRWLVYRNDDGTYGIQNEHTEKWWSLDDTSTPDKDNNKLVQRSTAMSWEIEVVGADYSRTLVSAKPYDSYTFTQGSTEVTSMNWMSCLPGNLPVSDLSIPGVHDAGTCSLTPISIDAKCQQQYVDDLLNAGVRFLDLRCADFEDDGDDDTKAPKINHTFDCLEKNGSLMTMYDVMGYVNDFFGGPGKHETIIFQINRQGDESKSVSTGKIWNYFKELVHKDPDKFYIGDHVPTLGECRGKIIIMTKLDPNKVKLNDNYVPCKDNLYIYGHETDDVKYTKDDATYWAFDISQWADKSDFEKAESNVLVGEGWDWEAWAEDNYDTSADVKWSQVHKSVEGAMQRRTDALGAFDPRLTWVITYTTASSSSIEGIINGGSITTPISCARNMNERLKTWDYLDQNKGNYTGVIAMDFVDEQLCQRIYHQNFNYGELVSSLEITGGPYKYNEGYPKTPASSELRVTTTTGNVLDNYFDCAFQYTDNREVGTAHAKAFAYNYLGLATCDFKIVKKTRRLNTYATVQGIDMTVGDIDENLALELFTDEEKAALENGAEGSVWIEVKALNDDEVPSADKKLLDTRASELGYQIGGYFDISMYKRLGDGEPIKIEELTNLSPKAKLQVAQNLVRAGRKYGILSAHKGKVLEHLLHKAQGESLDWNLSKFSTHVLIYQDESQPSNKVTPQRKATMLAKTGDERLPIVPLAAVGACILCLGWLVRKRVQQQ